MIVYGTGNKDLGEQFIPNETYPHCGAHNKIHVHGIARYFDVFFRYSNYILDQKPSLSDYQEGLDNNLDFINPDSYYYSVSEIDSLYNTGNLDILE